MAWLRIDDRLAMSVKVRGLVAEGVTSARAKAQRNEALGGWLRAEILRRGETTSES